MKNNKKVIFIGVGIVLLVAIILVCILLNNNNNSSNSEEKMGGDYTFTEQDLIDTYQLSGKDAINLVKENINSDSYEFSFSVSSDAMYVISIKNPINGNVFKYKLDPSTKSYYSIDE